MFFRGWKHFSSRPFVISQGVPSRQGHLWVQHPSQGALLWAPLVVSIIGGSEGRRSLLLLLSRFSRVRLCATPEMEAHQAPPSLGFSMQEHWSGLPFPSPMHESESEREVAQSCPTLSDPMDYSLPGSSIHGIFQARVLEWGAIAFS